MAEYLKLSRKKLDTLYFKVTQKIETLESKEAQLQKQKAAIIAERARILKAINADEGFIKLENTIEYKEFQTLDPQTKQERIKAVEEDMKLGAD